VVNPFEEAPETKKRLKGTKTVAPRKTVSKCGHRPKKGGVHLNPRKTPRVKEGKTWGKGTFFPGAKREVPSKSPQLGGPNLKHQVVPLTPKWGFKKGATQMGAPSPRELLGQPN